MDENKLELKDIAGYIVRGLKCLNKEGKVRYISGILLGEPGCDLELFDDGGNIESSYIEDIKPILHPISDLKKEIIVEGYNGDKPFIPMEKIAEILNFDGYCGIYTSFSVSDGEIHFSIWGGWVVDLDYSFNIIRSKGNESNAISFKMSMQIIELLNQWHFDYRGLIQKGLAIDINTIKR